MQVSVLRYGNRIEATDQCRVEVGYIGRRYTCPTDTYPSIVDCAIHTQEACESFAPTTESEIETKLNRPVNWNSVKDAGRAVMEQNQKTVDRLFASEKASAPAKQEAPEPRKKAAAPKPSADELAREARERQALEEAERLKFWWRLKMVGLAVLAIMLLAGTWWGIPHLLAALFPHPLEKALRTGKYVPIDLEALAREAGRRKTHAFDFMGELRARQAQGLEGYLRAQHTALWQEREAKLAALRTLNENLKRQHQQTMGARAKEIEELLRAREADMKRWSAEAQMAQTAAEREIVRREVEKLDAAIDRLKKELTA
jgi:hypothetical protein